MGSLLKVLLVLGCGQVQCVGQAMCVVELLQQVHVDLWSVIDDRHHQWCHTWKHLINRGRVT